jgi:16S rRNA A1518/A1519 N6-dimethyltransferase RsmA/KsgA/DIM1 with predicted DNA glycosylase/AP lyase activity
VAQRFVQLQVQQKEFIDFLKTAFAMKRKTLLNNSKKKYEEKRIRAALKESGARGDVKSRGATAGEERDGVQESCSGVSRFEGSM